MAGFGHLVFPAMRLPEHPLFLPVLAAAVVAAAVFLAPRTHTEDYTNFALSIVHEPGPAAYAGALTLVDGTADTKWTYPRSARFEDWKSPGTEQALRDILETFLALPNLEAYATEAGRQPDPATHFVITLCPLNGNKAGPFKTYAVPTASASPEFIAWLRKTGFPLR